ncbi:unnamed protein product, partial [Mesorhabditis spiculigera]
MNCYLLVFLVCLLLEESEQAIGIIPIRASASSGYRYPRAAAVAIARKKTSRNTTRRPSQSNNKQSEERRVTTTTSKSAMIAEVE